ncbi:hypothetical protein FHS38_006663 [Streptomyces netropsis]|uniref:Uncharacterized protein n=1 Tax=Streptomyces netropsis TaxID=55404 RepID=A0A7W7LJ13_STRNE|nr:hypothetical protein [Streptomyces netropsis]
MAKWKMELLGLRATLNSAVEDEHSKTPAPEEMKGQGPKK